MIPGRVVGVRREQGGSKVGAYPHYPPYSSKKIELMVLIHLEMSNFLLSFLSIDM